MIISSFQKD